MIVDKYKPQPTPQEPVAQPSEPKQPTPIEVAVNTNAMVGAYHAVRSILEELRVDPNDPESPRLFKAIKLDNGQLSRIKNNKHNLEYGIAFPAVFIHFIDVYYNQGTSKISEGRGTMRIHYVLNRLNNSDDDGEIEGLEVYKRIVAAIESKKNTLPALVSRFQLQYWDQPLSFDDGVQPYWIDYQIWFNDYTAYAMKDYVDAYVVSPPFTQHSDQNEVANPENLPNDSDPVFEDIAGFTEMKR